MAFTSRSAVKTSPWFATLCFDFTCLFIFYPLQNTYCIFLPPIMNDFHLSCHEISCPSSFCPYFHALVSKNYSKPLLLSKGTLEEEIQMCRKLHQEIKLLRTKLLKFPKTVQGDIEGVMRDRSKTKFFLPRR